MTVPLIFSKIFPNKKKLFWLLHSLFWTVHWSVGVFVNPFITSSINIFLEHIADNVIAFIFCLFLRYLYKKMRWHRYPLGVLVLLIIIYSIIGGLLWEYGMHLTVILFGGMPVIAKSFTYPYILRSLWDLSYVFVAWSSMYFGYKFWEEWHEQMLRLEKEQTLAHKVQLAFLRYQINPHFLYNTLCSLRALIQVDPRRAESMVTKISEFLRYSLLEGDNNEIPLSREIENIKVYLEIESIRFRENLNVEFKIDQKAEHYPIPVFLIHPLIENAIKYGMKTSPMPLKIFIIANVDDDRLLIVVKNTGRWIETDTHNGQSGIGLANIRKRLEFYCPNSHTMDIIKNDESVEVRIQLKSGEY